AAGGQRQSGAEQPCCKSRRHRYLPRAGPQCTAASATKDVTGRHRKAMLIGVKWLLLVMAAGACGGSASAVDAGGSGDDGQIDDIDGAEPPARLVAYVSGGDDIAWYDIDRSTGA